MVKSQITSRGIEIDEDRNGYIVRLTRNGHKQVKAHGLQSFSSVQDSVNNLMNTYQINIDAVGVPYRVIATIPLVDAKGWVFANFLQDHALILEPDALV